MSKERPILMSGPLVREILAGRKTVTRRPVKGAPVCDHVGWGCIGGQGFGFIFGDAVIRCPYGAQGDRLWVRETFEEIEDRTQRHAAGPEHFRAALRYRADEARRAIDVHMEHWRCKHEMPPRWTPGIHMPRWACRLVLDVLGVRVERLHEITDEDARHEGVEDRAGFEAKWKEIYGAESWGANPWVWRIEFRRVVAERSAA
jgi:hypothetical protein